MLGRRRVQIMAVAATAMAATMTAGGVARAGNFLDFQDGFEGHPETSWQIGTSGDGQAGFEEGTGSARTGANNGWLFATHGSAAEGIDVDTEFVAGQGTFYCQAAMWVNSVGISSAGWSVTDQNGNPVGGGNGQFPTNKWVQITSNVWPLNSATTMIHISVYITNNTGKPAIVRLDDFGTHCWTG